MRKYYVPSYTFNPLAVRSRQYFPAAVGFQWAYQAAGLHFFDEPGRAVIADLEPALDIGNGCLAGFGNDPHRLIIKRVGIVGLVSSPGMSAAPPLFGIQGDVIQVVRTAAALDVLDDLVHLVVIDKRAVYPDRHAGPRRQEQHVAVPEQVLSAHLIKKWCANPPWRIPGMRYGKEYWP